MPDKRPKLRTLFSSTQGLVCLAIGLVALVTAIWGLLSGPMAELGAKDALVSLLGMQLQEAEREGRIVILYHSMGVAAVATVVYLITYSVSMTPQQQAGINRTVTVAYMLTLFGGLGFAYFGHNWLLHALYVAGLAIMFWGGTLLAWALWPWREKHKTRDPGRSRTRGGLDLERTAFFAMAVATLGSALFGAAAGAYYGNGFTTFLAENLIREPHKSLLQYSVIGHLHIMVALLAIAVTLLVGRWLDFRGSWHKLAMPPMILGILLMTAGVWGIVTPLQPIAHTVIYVGATPSMLAALFLVSYGFGKLVREQLPPGTTRPSLWQKLAALVADPLRFGALWQMVFMNFTVSGIGIFMAVRLDEVFREWAAREERIVLTGHWHILSAIIATIILFRFADMVGLRGKARRWFGWSLIIGSDVAFGATTVFALKRLFVSEYAQRPVVDTALLLVDVGLVAVLLALASFLVWCLVGLFAGGTVKRAGQPGVRPLLLVVLLCLPLGLAGCGQEAAEGRIPAAARTDIQGAKPSWVQVGEGAFLAGQYSEKVRIDHAFELMAFEVTNAQYVEYLNGALRDKVVRVEEGDVLGFYPGDEYHGGEHERRIDEGYWLQLPLTEDATRVQYDGTRFSVVPGYERHPVTMVTWFGAQAYCEYYGWRLPAELEWEKAARGSDGRPFPWGDGIGGGYANYYHSGDPFELANQPGDTTPAGFYNGETHAGFSTINNASPYGAYDMAGNVAEWTANSYEGTHYRYFRGGSKADYAHDLRTWSRNNAGPDFASPNVGLRCVRPTGVHTGADGK